MPKIYLRVQNYVAAYYRNIWQIENKFNPIVFQTFNIERNIIRDNSSFNVPVDDQLKSGCLNQYTWNNILNGKLPDGSQKILNRKRNIWPSASEISTLINRKPTSRVLNQDYLCLYMPEKIYIGQKLIRTNSSWSINAEGTVRLCRTLTDNFIIELINFIICDRAFCNNNPSGYVINRSRNSCLERFYLCFGLDEVFPNSDTFRREVNRWLVRSRTLVTDRINYKKIHQDFYSHIGDDELLNVKEEVIKWISANDTHKRKR